MHQVQQHVERDRPRHVENEIRVVKAGNSAARRRVHSTASSAMPAHKGGSPEKLIGDPEWLHARRSGFRRPRLRADLPIRSAQACGMVTPPLGSRRNGDRRHFGAVAAVGRPAKRKRVSAVKWVKVLPVDAVNRTRNKTRFELRTTCLVTGESPLSAGAAPGGRLAGFGLSH